jgi:hypothetical protein
MRTRTRTRMRTRTRTRTRTRMRTRTRTRTSTSTTRTRMRTKTSTSTTRTRTRMRAYKRFQKKIIIPPLGPSHRPIRVHRPTGYELESDCWTGDRGQGPLDSV